MHLDVLRFELPYVAHHADTRLSFHQYIYSESWQLFVEMKILVSFEDAAEAAALTDSSSVRRDCHQ